MLSSVTLNCQAGWHKLWQAGKRLARTNRIFEDQEVSQGALSRSEADLIPWSSILSPQSSVHSPQSLVLNPQSLVPRKESLITTYM